MNQWKAWLAIYTIEIVGEGSDGEEKQNEDDPTDIDETVEEVKHFWFWL